MSNMGKLKLSGKDLIQIGYPQGPVISAAINTIAEHYPTYKKAEILKILEQVRLHPINYQGDKILGSIASFLIPKKKDESEIYLNNTGVPGSIYGKGFIEREVAEQVHNAAKVAKLV